MNIKDMVSDNKCVVFVRYQNGELWYATECGFNFPVPITDAGTAVFKAQDKALLFMRWIKRHIKQIEDAKMAAP